MKALSARIGQPESSMAVRTIDFYYVTSLNICVYTEKPTYRATTLIFGVSKSTTFEEMQS